MNLPHDAQLRLDGYLRDVERCVGSNPNVRREVVDEVRDHVLETLRQKGLEQPTLEDVEKVLADMDPPESFADPALPGKRESVVVAAAASGGARASSRWFLLALGFLAVNGYGVWCWTRSLSAGPTPPPPDPPQTNVVGTVTNPVPLALLSVSQVDVTGQREVTLGLRFNAAPNRDYLSKYLKLSEKDNPDLGYRILGAAGASDVMVVTETVNHDDIQVVLEPGLPAATNGYLPGIRCELAMTIQSELQVQRLDATSPSFGPCSILVRMNGDPDLDPSGLGSMVVVDPAVSFTAEVPEEYWLSGIRLSGDFKPGAVYTITIKGGLASASGLTLLRDQVRTVRFPDRPAGLEYANSGRYLSPKGSLVVPVSAVNIDAVEVSLEPVFANNLVQLAHREDRPWMYYGGLTEYLTGDEVVFTNVLSLPLNQSSVVPINLRNIAGHEPRGVYRMTVGHPKVGASDRLVVITDLGLAARVAPQSILVWVNSLRDAMAIPRAEVVLYGENNQEISRGTTDEHGLVSLPATAADRPFLITARAGDDLTYLDLRRTQVSQGENLGGPAYLSEDALEAAVFTERGVYRPGETVFVQALIRDRQVKAPESFPLVIRVRRPDGRVFRDVPVTPDALGSVDAAVVLPEYLPTGRYGFEVAMPGTFTVLGETSVAMEDFVPPQIRVALEAPVDRLVAGTDLEFHAKSEYLFGRPAAGLKAQAYVTFKAVPFSPSAWPGWTFGDNEKSFASIYRQPGTNVLDESGRCTFSVESSSAWRPPAAIQAVMQVVVSESSGRTVTSYGSTPLDVYPHYIGLRLAGEGILRAGNTQRVAVVEVLPDGSPVATGQPLVMKLARVQWNSVLRKSGAGRYEWVSERQLTVLREETFAAGGDVREWSFLPDTTGQYLLLAIDPGSGASSSVEFSAAGAGQEWVEWSREKPDRIELVADRPSYRPGDTAKILAKAPFSGTALLTVESDRILDQRVVVLEKNTAELEIPVLPDYAPNVYATLTLIRPAVAESVWSAHRAIGAVSLPVEPPGKRLSVAIEVAPTNKPQAGMPVRITVRDEEGATVSGDVTVMAVDEGICSLSAFETPDPMDTFLAQRRLAVTPFDLYAELMPIVEDALVDQARVGGDGSDAMRKRLNPVKANRFKPVALWQTHVRLDTNGTASTTFDLPEFSGELRVMAIAYNASQAGSTQANVKVKRDVVVQTSLPRFLATGDECKASIDLHNESGRAVPVTLRITCGGPLAASEPEWSGTLDASASTSIALPLRAGEVPGKALCTVEVSGGDDTFRETIELAVRPAAGLRASSVYRVLAAGESLALEPPEGWLTASVSQDVIVSGEPSLQLGEALRYVMNYPYGCLEQTVSGSFPLLFASDLANRILPDSSSVGDVAGYVRAGVLRVLSMQQPDGSFALWPYQRSTDRGASLYAAHFLVEASRTTYPVPQERLAAALAWLRERLDQTAPTDVDPNNAAWADDMQERAYACHILALAGRPDAGWNARLRDQAHLLRYAARVHLAAALLLSGEPRQATELLSRMGLPEDGPRELGGLLNSDVRDAALLLSTWLDVDPTHEAVARLAKYIDDRQRDGHWGTTQDNAMALLALGKYAQRVPEDKRPFTGSLVLPSGAIVPVTSTQDVRVASVPGEGGAVVVTNDGPGMMHVGVRFEGVSREAEAEEDRGIAIRRDYFDLDGDALEPDELTQGDLIIVQLVLDTGDRDLDNVAIEELLPAGWEIENPNLATAQQIDWVREKSDWCKYRDVRDDRLLLFSGRVFGRSTFYYAARAVTPGTYAYPPVTAACMYGPEIRSVHGGRTVHVVP